MMKVYIKLEMKGDESNEEGIRQAQRLADYLNVGVEVDTNPYKTFINPSTEKPEEGAVQFLDLGSPTPKTCFCGGIGGHSTWCPDYSD